MIDLEIQARRARQLVLAMIYHAGSGHPGGSLSAIEAILSIYQKMEAGHRFVLSKGHAAPALYAALALTGRIPLAECGTFRKIGSRLQGHPSVVDLDPVEASTGSLGQGFSAAIGLALGNRFLGKSDRFFCMLGDGELQEGQIWEGAMFAAQRRLNNLTAIVDYNKLQSDDRNENIISLEPLMDRWQAFGWHVLEIEGHQLPQLVAALDPQPHTRPTVIIAHTLKGKGVSFMEDHPAWHGSVKLRPDEYLQALDECGAGPSPPEMWLQPEIFEQLETIWEAL